MRRESAERSPPTDGRAAAMSSTFSVKDVTERYGVSAHTVLGWIRSGELRAVNVGRRAGAKKPRWRISEEALEAFELIRTATPPVPRVRQKKRVSEVMEFIR
jgi:excisionase family DNA binding protein